MKIRECKVCGKKFEARNNQLCCSKECSDISRREAWSRHRAELKAERERRLAGAASKSKKISLCDKEYCKGCVYYRNIYHSQYAKDTAQTKVCLYCYYTGIKRPCSAGKGCTAKTKDNSVILEFKRRQRQF